MNVRTTSIIRFYPVLVAAIILLAATTNAQESRATLSGTVTDPGGLAMPGANVMLVNPETGVSFATTTNETGQYRFVFLNPGTYRLSAQKPGSGTSFRRTSDYRSG